MTNKQRLEFKCWNPDCTNPNETHSHLIEPDQKESLLLIGCPYCGEESEVDLSDPAVRTAVDQLLRNSGESLKLEGIDASQVIQTQPRTPKKD